MSLFPPSPAHELVDWHVIFDGGSGCQFGPAHWLTYLRPGFRHVYCARYDGGRWTVLESMTGAVRVWTLPCVPGYDFPDWRASEGATVVRLRRWREPHHFRMRGILTCVSLTKFLLGVGAWWIVTPWQLYRHLVANEEAKETERIER